MKNFSATFMLMTESELLRLITQALNDLQSGDYRFRLKPFPENLEDKTRESELRRLYQSVQSLKEKYQDADTFILNLSIGNLEAEAPASNQLISPFRELQSNLRHLVWQTHRIAEGDYSQRIDFLGEFSTSFNNLILSLREKQVLENELKIQTEELRELNATKDKFFSIIAHDLRNPFNALLNFTEFLIEEIEINDREQAMHTARIIQDSAKSTYELLQNLLEWSLIQQGRVPFHPEQISLSSVVQEEFHTLEQIAVQKEITLSDSVPAEMLVTADRNMFRTVLRNLISNALKYTFTGGKVQVSASPVAGGIEVFVRDNGMGMDQEEIAKLFLLSNEKSKPGTHMEKGSGLGLVLCKDFIARHNGTIRVESEQGRGSTFVIFLPEPDQNE